MIHAGANVVFRLRVNLGWEGQGRDAGSVANGNGCERPSRRPEEAPKPWQRSWNQHQEATALAWALVVRQTR